MRETIRVASTSDPQSVAESVAASTRNYRELPVLQAIGPAAVYAAVKAIIASRRLGLGTDFNVGFVPSFDTVPAGENGEERTVLRFALIQCPQLQAPYTTAKALRVSKTTPAPKLAGSISAELNRSQIVVLHAIGAAAVNQAIKAIAISRRHLGPSGWDIHVVPGFIEVELAADQYSEDGMLTVVKLELYRVGTGAPSEVE